MTMTSTEQRRTDKVRRRDAKRRRSQGKRASALERDAKLKAISDDFLPRIARLQEQHRAALANVWRDWREGRS